MPSLRAAEPTLRRARAARGRDGPQGPRRAGRRPADRPPSRSVASAPSGAHHAQALVAGLTGTTMLSAGRRGKYLRLPARLRRCTHDPSPHERSAAAGGPGGDAPAAHPCGRCTSMVRNRRSSGSSIPGRSARSWCSIPTRVGVELPELARLGVDPDRRRARPGPVEGAAARPPPAAEAVAPRPARDRRHRQHLRRRDPAPGRDSTRCARATR